MEITSQWAMGDKSLRKYFVNLVGCTRDHTDLWVPSSLQPVTGVSPSPTAIPSLVLLTPLPHPTPRTFVSAGPALDVLHLIHCRTGLFTH